MRIASLFLGVCCCLSAAGGQWLEQTVIIGDTMGGLSLRGGVVVNPISGNVYVEGSPIQVFNPANAQKVRAIGSSGAVVFCPPSGKGYVVGDSAVVLDAAADTVAGSVTLPFAPATLAYSFTSNRLYLGSANERDPLVVFDPNGDSVLKVIAVGYPVTALLWDSVWDRLYVGIRSHAGLLRVLDCATDTFVRDVWLGLREATGFALASGSRKLYCAGILDTSATGAVVAVSTDSLQSLGVVPNLPRPNQMAYSPVTDRLYCGATASGYDHIYIVDCRRDTVRAQVEAYVQAIVANTLNGRVYAGESESGTVLVLDTLDSIAGEIDIKSPGNYWVGALTFWTDRRELYGALDHALAFVVDATLDTAVTVLDYTAYTPRRMVHNPAGNKLYLLCPTQDALVVMDSTCAVTACLDGAAVNSYAFPVLNPALNRLYVADARTLRVIDCNTDRVILTAFMGGVSRPKPVLVPDLNQLYVFSGSGSGDFVYVHYGLRDSTAQLFYLPDAVPSAVYEPRSGRVFFACEQAPSLRVLDPNTNSEVRSFSLAGGSNKGRLAVNPELGRLYYADQRADSMWTIDVLEDSVVGSLALPWDMDSLILNRRLGKLYLCSRDTAGVLAFDCRQNAMVDTINADFRYWALMNDRNDKLYLRYGAVVDCRYDSVVTQLNPIDVRCMAWNLIDNRVYQAVSRSLYVYRDDPTGIEEPMQPEVGQALVVLSNPSRGQVRLRVQALPGQSATLHVHDAAGRLVLESPIAGHHASFAVDLGSAPAGVYFLSLETGGARTTSKVVLQR
ncbi:T9SS type A sorting domain-containing protein [candidate division WOR-3 bacterium]|nr:T9SS type A sorting domain-containing protein [candidate division WOR-3 bacterium]